VSAAPQISVVIPTLGRRGLLRRVLDRLDEQTAAAHRFEVIVVADAKHPGIEELDRLIADRRYRVRRLQANLPGASAARNTGWQAAEASLLLFIDDDILPEARLVDEHLAWHQRHCSPEVGVLGRVRWASELRVTPFMRWLDHGIQFDYSAIAGIEAHWGHFYTANASVKRLLVQRVGGFDEQRLPFGYEDLDLALRMHRRGGLRLLYNRAAVAEHVHPMDLGYWKHRVTRIAVSERRFVEIHPDVPPYFYEMFSTAAARPRVTGGGARVARFVPRRLPTLGPRVWSRADAFYRQALAPSFLQAWHAAEAPRGPQSSSREPSTPASSPGSPPGGP